MKHRSLNWRPATFARTSRSLPEPDRVSCITGTARRTEGAELPSLVPTRMPRTSHGQERQ